MDAYQIDRFEVTTKQYRECIGAGACDASPIVTGDTRYVRDEWPVVNVTWFDARDYCRYRAKRLPTEAEWEKAARGADGRPWPWGSVRRIHGANLGTLEALPLRLPIAARLWAAVGWATDERDGAKLLVPPGTFRDGRSPYGVYDLAGNVSEWVADAYSEAGYSGLPVVDPRAPEAGAGAARVARGGSFFEPRYVALTYYRSAGDPERRAFFRGFRCARDP